MKKVKCLNCSYEQVLTKEKIYQDINGKFMVCEECNGSFDVEYEEDYVTNSYEEAKQIMVEGFKKDIVNIRKMNNEEINEFLNKLEKY
jgi:peptide subunit release factor 1 (eRF1)